MGGAIAAYAAELLICVCVRVFSLDEQSLWLCYVNPWFRGIGEGLTGVLLCEEMPRIQQLIDRWNASALEAIAALAFIGSLLLCNVVHLHIMSAWLWVIPVSLILIAFRKDAGSLSKALSRRPWQLLGDISFELYMTHAFVYEGIPVAAGIVSKSIQAWIVYHAGTRFLITLVASIVFAWAVHIALDWLYKRLWVR